MAGLDRDTLFAAMAALDEFAKRRLPDAKLLELDAKDECPREIIAEMCGPELGIQLFFLPEELHGMGAGSFSIAGATGSSPDAPSRDRISATSSGRFVG